MFVSGSVRWGDGRGIRTHEKVVGVWDWASDAKEFHEVVELAVYVTTDGDGGVLGVSG